MRRKKKQNNLFSQWIFLGENYFYFASGYQLEIPSVLGMGQCVHLSSDFKIPSRPVPGLFLLPWSPWVHVGKRQGMGSWCPPSALALTLFVPTLPKGFLRGKDMMETFLLRLSIPRSHMLCITECLTMDLDKYSHLMEEAASLMMAELIYTDLLV